MAAKDPLDMAVDRIARRLAEGDTNRSNRSLFGNVDTYNDKGQLATTMTRDITGRRTITQYDENGHATVSQELGNNDVVNFANGYISSIVKYESDEFLNKMAGRTTIQYGPNGKMLSSVHESRINVGDEKNMWVTTSKTTYHDNGKVATHVTYKQRQNHAVVIPDNITEEAQRLLALAEVYRSERISDSSPTNTTVDSYVASIEQMDESGKILLSVQLHELDEVNYHPTGRVASILRKDKAGNPQTMVSYDENGKIQNQTVYQNGRVISSTDYTDGKPTSNAQQSNEEYQNIFEAAKSRVDEKIPSSDEPAPATPVPTKERD